MAARRLLGVGEPLDGRAGGRGGEDESVLRLAAARPEADAVIGPVEQTRVGQWIAGDGCLIGKKGEEEGGGGGGEEEMCIRDRSNSVANS